MRISLPKVLLSKRDWMKPSLKLFKRDREQIKMHIAKRSSKVNLRKLGNAYWETSVKFRNKDKESLKTSTTKSEAKVFLDWMQPVVKIFKKDKENMRNHLGRSHDVSKVIIAKNNNVKPKTSKESETEAMPPPAEPSKQQKFDIEKEEEKKLQNKFPGMPNRPMGAKGAGGHSAFLQKRFAKGQKFSDSGDYQMAKQKDLLDADKEADLEQDEMRDEDASNTTNDTIASSVSSGRNLYTVNEDLKIVKFIAETKRFDEVGGNTLWKLMEDRNVVPNRSWHSLKERFRKVIMKKIDQFEMADDVRASFFGIGGKKNEKQNKKSK